MKNERVARLALAFGAPALAIVAAFLITSLVLVLAGDSVSGVWGQILSLPSSRGLVNIINSASVYYLSAVAVAIGFRMNLFNIGVDGQYRIASFAAAVLAGEAWPPGIPQHVFAVFAAMLVGAAWAGIAGLLRVTRGVSEVISTIMLNAIATALVGLLVAQGRRRQRGQQHHRDQGDPGEQLDSRFQARDSPNEVYGFVLLAILVGIIYGFVINRTRFGFDLRATGKSESAAVASGINVKRMASSPCCCPARLPAWWGCRILLGDAHSYGSTFQSGLGFAGIAIALLGRNHPVGIGLGALLFAFLDEQSNPLQILLDMSPDIVKITQGVIVLTVVIAYEVVRRYAASREQQQVASALDSENKEVSA